MKCVLPGLLAGGLLLVGCSPAPQGIDSTPANASANAAAVPTASNDLAERAKAEAWKEFSKSWTNTGGVWTSYVTQRKSLIQMTNVSVRVESIELTESQRKKGLTAGVEVFFVAQLARNHTDKKGWSDWRPTAPKRYPVTESNGVLYVENSYRKSFVLPPSP